MMMFMIMVVSDEWMEFEGITCASVPARAHRLCDLHDR